MRSPLVDPQPGDRVRSGGNAMKCAMCASTVAVWVKIPADLACEGRDKWKECAIDACIAPLVHALQQGGIDMRGSCCGHGKRRGEIHLQDGRLLLVLNAESAERHLVRSRCRRNKAEAVEEE
jgi:hypothetical protein